MKVWHKSIFFVIALIFLCAVREARALSFQEAWEMVKERNPDLQLARSFVLRAKGEQTRASVILPDNPYLELNYRNGNRAQSRTISPDLYGFYGSESQNSYGTELGISQEFEVAGQRSHRMDAARLGLDVAGSDLKKLELDAFSRLRLYYFGYSARLEILEHLKGHQVSLRGIRRRLGNNFRDPRIGPYAIIAFDTDLVTLDGEIQKQQILALENERSLRFLGIDAGEKIAVPDFESISLPPAPEAGRAVESAKKNSLDLKFAELSVSAAESGLELAQSEAYPNVTLFFSTGRDIYGNSSISPNVGIPSERNDFVRFGLRIPVPVVNRNQGGREIARANLASQKIKLDRVQRELEFSVKSAVEKYRLRLELLAEMKANLRAAEQSLSAISEALIQRRISYIEFWSEHERWHDIHIRYLDTFINALEYLGQMEAHIGVPVEQISGDAN